MAIQQRDFDRLMNQVRTMLPGSSDSGIKGVMFDVINEFFDVSNAWTEWLAITIQVNNQAYAVYPQQGGMITRLVSVFDSNQVPLPASIILNGIQPLGEATVSITPSSVIPLPGAILLLTFPQNTSMTATALVVKNVILPNSADEVPDAPQWLFPLYARYIQEGIVGTMQLQKGKPYYDNSPTGAVFHLKKFRDGMAMAKVATMRSNLFGGQSWRYPAGWRTNSQRGGVSTPFPTPSGQGL